MDNLDKISKLNTKANALATAYTESIKVGEVNGNIVLIPCDGFGLPWIRILISQEGAKKLLMELDKILE